MLLREVVATLTLPGLAATHVDTTVDIGCCRCAASWPALAVATVRADGA
jgi:hypothetical protein